MEQDAVLPAAQIGFKSHDQSSSKTHEIEDIDPSYIFPDGSITEITEYTDLMCKSGKETEYYIVSKSFPYREYTVVQYFRKIRDTKLDIDTYVRGECIEYQTVEPRTPQKQVPSSDSLEEVLASFRIQKNLSSRVLLLSKPLTKRKQQGKEPRRIETQQEPLRYQQEPLRR